MDLDELPLDQKPSPCNCSGIAVRQRRISKQTAPTTGRLAIALLSFMTIGTDVASAASNEVVVEKNVSVSGNDAGLEEYKKKLILSVGVSQARLFRVKNQIVRTSAADPRIAEPVVVASNQLYIRGLSTGITSMTLWDDVGAVIHLEVRVDKNNKLLNSTVSALRDDIDQRLLPAGDRNSLLCAEPAELILEECATKGTHYRKPHENSTPVSSESSQPVKLPREDILTFDFGEKKEQVMIRTGFGSENYKPAKTINLVQSQSRVFQTKNGIASTTICDPKIAEPVVVSKRSIVVLGKNPGKTIMVLHDDSENEEAYDLQVRNNANAVSATISALRNIFLNKILHMKTQTHIPETTCETLEIAEIESIKTIDLEPSHQKLFKTQNSIVRTVVSDPNIAELVVVSSTEIAMLGSAPGKTTIFIWDDVGNISALKLRVTGKSTTNSESGSEAKSCVAHSESSSLACEVECWSGSAKSVLNVRDTSEDPILSVITLISLPNTKSPDRTTAIYLNNEGVRVLVARNFNLAIRKLQSAVKADPSYRRARTNLAIAYNNLGLSLNKRSPTEAMKQFHSALFLDPQNVTTVANLDGIIRMMGRNPSSFKDRVDFGDQALLIDDIAGGIIEYKAALEIRDDPDVRAKLNELTSKIDRFDTHESIKD